MAVEEVIQKIRELENEIKEVKDMFGVGGQDLLNLLDTTRIELLSIKQLLGQTVPKPCNKRKSEDNDVITRRVTTAKKIKANPSPSEWAKSNGGCTTQEEYRHHRPESLRDIPVQFYHATFDKFLKLIDQPPADLTQEKQKMMEFASVMSRYFDNEFIRTDIVRRFFNAVDIPLETHSGGAYKTDGSNFIQVAGHVIPICNVEVKSDFRSGTDPYAQSSSYYGKFIAPIVTSKTPLAMITCFPSFLLILEGPNLAVCGAVFTDAACINRLTHIISLERATYNDMTLDYAARVLYALKACMTDLKEYYGSLNRIITDKIGEIPAMISNCVYPRQFSGIPEFRYISKIAGSKALWKAEMNCFDTLLTVVVKFTRQYGTEAHKACAEVGLAPKLHAVHDIGYGWKLVVMDFLKDYTTLFELDRNELEGIRNVVIEAVKKFHSLGFVHGDLRAPNFMWNTKDLKIIDFDWAGPAGEARYPHSLNPGILWHPDVGIYKLIGASHDVYLSESL